MLVPTVNGLPVLLPSHDHPEFGTPGKHYHLDYRFLNDEPRQDRVIHSDEQPIYQDVEQVRTSYITLSSSVSLPFHLAKRFDRSVCGKCPHKGLEIIDGVCPGHSLCFDENGFVIKDYFLEISGIRSLINKTKGLFEFVMIKESIISEALIISNEKLLGKLLIGPVTAFPGDIVKLTLN